MYTLKSLLIVLSAWAVSTQVVRSQHYQYTVDLTRLQEDKFYVSLITPEVTERKVVFALPKIIPGTYSISDYGAFAGQVVAEDRKDRKSTRLNSSHVKISYAVFCLKKKKNP